MKTKTFIGLLLCSAITFAGCGSRQETDTATAQHDSLFKPTVVVEQLTTSQVGTVLPDLSAIDFVKIARDKYGPCGEHRALALSVGWPAEEWETLSMVMRRESNCTPTAWSGSDAGLMQINRIHTKWAAEMGLKWPDDLFDARHNLMFAYYLWNASGWSPWRFSGEVPG